MQIQAMDAAVKRVLKNERGPCAAMDGKAEEKCRLVGEMKGRRGKWSRRLLVFNHRL